MLGEKRQPSTQLGDQWTDWILHFGRLRFLHLSFLSTGASRSRWFWKAFKRKGRCWRYKGTQVWLGILISLVYKIKIKSRSSGRQRQKSLLWGSSGSVVVMTQLFLFLPSRWISSCSSASFGSWSRSWGVLTWAATTNHSTGISSEARIWTAQSDTEL